MGDATPNGGMMQGGRVVAPEQAERALRELFGLTVRLSLDDLDLQHEATARYLGDLLARFTAIDALHPRGVAGNRLDGVADVLGEIRTAWTLDGPSFDPGRELSLRRFLADSTLLMSGFFWERARAASTRRHYIRIGRWAYRFLADHARVRGVQDVMVYRRLANRFESYAGALAYLREVYLDANLAPWPHPLISRVTRAQ